MNSSQEDTFRSLMDYFNGRRFRILVSNQPYLIRAEIGAYWSMSRGDAKGEVEASITKRNGGSYVNFNFNFTKEYITGLIASSIGALVLYFLGWGVANMIISRMPSANGVDLSLLSLFVNGVIIFGIVMIFLAVMAIEGQNASITRKKFINEFNTFAQSLPPPPPKH